VVAIGRPVRIARSVNLVGLERAGFSRETIKAIREAYNLIKKNETKSALAQIAEQVNDFPELQKIIDFYNNSPRGVIPFATVEDDLS
jgi:UDP-N-acetylglucosamine acyltransferase